MLSHHEAVANIAVQDIATAHHFYEGTLGFTVSDSEGKDVVAYRSGHSTILIYRSDYAGPIRPPR